MVVDTSVLTPLYLPHAHNQASWSLLQSVQLAGNPGCGNARSPMWRVNRCVCCTWNHCWRWLLSGHERLCCALGSDGLHQLADRDLSLAGEQHLPVPRHPEPCVSGADLQGESPPMPLSGSNRSSWPDQRKLKTCPLDVAMIMSSDADDRRKKLIDRRDARHKILVATAATTLTE